MNDDCPRCAGVGFKHAQCPSCKTGPWEVSDVTRQLIERDQHGRQKYGVTLDRTDLSHADWLQHMAEELMDGAGYALAAKREYERMQQGVGVPREVLLDWRRDWLTDRDHDDERDIVTPFDAYLYSDPSVPPMSPAGYRVQGLGFDHATGGFASVRIDGVTFAAQLVARRMMQAPQPVVDGSYMGMRIVEDTSLAPGEFRICSQPQAPQPELPKSAAIGSKSVDGDVAWALPGLPPPFEHDSGHGFRNHYYYSSEQMRYYALQALAAYSANTGGVQQGVTDAATRMGYASVMDALDDLADYRKDAGQQAVTDAMILRACHEGAKQAGQAWLDLEPEARARLFDHMRARLERNVRP